MLLFLCTKAAIASTASASSWFPLRSRRRTAREGEMPSRRAIRHSWRGHLTKFPAEHRVLILIVTLGSIESDKSMAKKAISPSPASAMHRPSASHASKGIKRVFRSREEGFLHRRQSSKFLCIIYFSLMYFWTIPQLPPEKLRRLCPHGGAVGGEPCLQRRRTHFCHAAIFFRRKDEQKNPRGLSLPSDDRPRRFLQLLLRATFTFVILW